MVYTFNTNLILIVLEPGFLSSTYFCPSVLSIKIGCKIKQFYHVTYAYVKNVSSFYDCYQIALLQSALSNTLKFINSVFLSKKYSRKICTFFYETIIIEPLIVWYWPLLVSTLQHHKHRGPHIEFHRAFQTYCDIFFILYNIDVVIFIQLLVSKYCLKSSVIQLPK